MSLHPREVFVISDLHLGGRVAVDGGRGFRMMTEPAALAAFVDGLRRPAAARAGERELVIAGDFVDFLSEESETPGVWQPLVTDPARAADLLSGMVAGPGFADVFEALRGFLDDGHRLTILLGNHDIELSYPVVRERLAEILGRPPGHGFAFIFDGEGYRVGKNALVEHGNRYDRFNVVDHDRLRRLRSLQSRGQHADREAVVFEAPVGSRMVAEIMNPLKRTYAFVDLLKPETEAVIPLLLALEPDKKSAIVDVVRVLAPAVRHGLSDAGDVPVRLSDASAGGGGPGDDEVLEAILASAALDAPVVLGGEGGAPAPRIRDASAWSQIRRAAGLWSIAHNSEERDLEARLPALHGALRVLQRDRSFDPGYETAPEYERAARALSERGFEYVVLGHTHLARQIRHDRGWYLNSGTWADLMRLPDALLAASPDDALPALRAFVADLKANRLDRYLMFLPTYVRLELDGDGRVVDGRLLPAKGARRPGV
jgi:UDP-2,3-diacylglucosamine pyrophosphatase LpxH